MSEERDAASSDRPGFIERLRSLFRGGSAREELEEALDDASAQTDFSPQERLILRNVLSFHDLRVADVMVPRADIIAIPAATTLGDVLATFRTEGHSRLPVYGETLDDPRGMVHIRDFVDYVAGHAEIAAAPPADAADGRRFGSVARLDLALPLASAGILRPVLFVPPSMPALDLLVKMQSSRTHMALVIDEYGGTDGLASIEDIMEVIVGDIEDEHDEHSKPMIEATADGAYLVDARAPLDEVAEVVGFEPGAGDEMQDVDTIGGFAAALAGHLPTRGEILRLENRLEIEVLDADPRRLKRLRLRKASALEPAPSEEPV